MENKIPVGLVRDLPYKRTAWVEVERLHLPINPVDSRRGGTFGDPALHYAEHEVVEHSESIHPKAHTTIKGYERVLRNRLLPKWGTKIALGIEPLEIEEWLTTLKKEEELENPTLDRMRRVMSMVYRHGQRYGMIPRTLESNPYVGMAFSNVVAFFIILTAASTLHAHSIMEVATCAQAAAAPESDRRAFRSRAIRRWNCRYGAFSRAGARVIGSLWDRGGVSIAREPRTAATASGWFL